MSLSNIEVGGAVLAVTRVETYDKIKKIRKDKIIFIPNIFACFV